MKTLTGIILLLLAIILFKNAPLLAVCAFIGSCVIGGSASSTAQAPVFAGLGVVALLSMLVLLFFN